MTGRLAALRDKINDRSAVIGVVGLGYVGLPVACLFASKGFRVIGVDVKAERVARINAGRSPIEGHEPGLAELLANVIASGRLSATTDISELCAAHVVTINVDTPIDPDHHPRYEALRAACRALGEVAQDGALIIVESTIGPGTMTRVVRSALEAVSADRHFQLGHCPERVMPGKLLSNLRSISRVVGAETPELAEVMLTLYRQIVEAELDPADLLTAELVKTGENAYRDVNIAFANELALICQEAGGDVWRVRDLINKSPGRNVLRPGAGVGGHCIPKDPWLLASASEEVRSGSLIAAARRVNDGMPAEVARLTVDCLEEVGAPKRPRVAVLGYAYLEDSDDGRNSPTAALVAELVVRGCDTVIHDPFVPGYAGDVLEVFTGADCAVLMVAHTLYRKLDLREVATLMRRPAFVDGRRVFSPEDLRSAGFALRVLGMGLTSASA